MPPATAPTTSALPVVPRTRFDEFARAHPLRAFLAVTFSNRLSNEFYQIEAMEEYEARQGKTGREILLAAVAAVVIAAVVIFPLLYLLTLVEHP